MLEAWTEERIVELLSEIIGRLDRIENDICYFAITSIETEKKVVVSRNDIVSALDLLSKAKEYSESGIISANYLEVHIREESRIMGYSRLREGELSINDTENFVQYEVSNLSLAYIIYIIAKALELGPVNDVLRSPMSRNMLRRRIAEDSCEQLSVIEYFGLILFRYPSIKIKAQKIISAEVLSNYLMSFIFQISYNTGYVVIPQKNIYDIFRNRRIGHVRRARIDELDPPRRIYPTDIINHYQMALASESPYLEYLSYYHVLEHFFDAVFNDDLVESIKSTLTAPSFSYKRKKDIMSLVKAITRSVQVRNEDLVFSELEALKLTISKYVTISDLKNELDAYDSAIISYYKSTKVAFSDGDMIDFDEQDQQKVLKNITNRVYKTRNSLVHSKENDKSKYTPFHDDKNLIPEIALLRFMAEQVILNTSKIIE